MATYVAGPWLGELGWELFCWQGRLRYLANAGHNIHVFCPRDKEFIYRDFAKVNTVPNAGEVSGHLDRGVSVIPANKALVAYSPSWDCNTLESKGFYKQVFKKWGTSISDAPDVLIHARNRSIRGGDNWAGSKYIDVCRQLADMGLSIGSVGLSNATKDLGVHAKDMRDCSLADLTNYMASAKCILGTSSGPLHLASLCGCPQIVFNIPVNNNRYRHHWNPFGTNVYMMETWQPTVDMVVATVKEHLCHTYSTQV